MQVSLGSFSLAFSLNQDLSFNLSVEVRLAHEKDEDWSTTLVITRTKAIDQRGKYTTPCSKTMNA